MKRRDSRLRRVGRLERMLLETRSQEIAAYENLLANPYLKEKQRLLGYRLLLLAHQGEPGADGMIHLSAAEISNDYRKKPEPGGSWDDENPDGSLPLARRETVKGIINDLIDAGALDAEIGECHREHENGSLYRDSDFIVSPVSLGGLADRINALAGYRRDKSRAPYGMKGAA